MPLVITISHNSAELQSDASRLSLANTRHLQLFLNCCCPAEITICPPTFTGCEENHTLLCHAVIHQKSAKKMAKINIFAILSTAADCLARG